MTQIITALPRYSDGEIDRAFMREIKNGFKREQATEKYRVAQAAREAKHKNTGTRKFIPKNLSSTTIRSSLN
jgi:hypothetical protein